MSLSRKRRFARNLDKLLKARNLSRKEAVAGALVPYQWLRRAVVEGISRIETRNSAHLSSLAEHLGLPSPDCFWDPALYVEPARDSIEYEADRNAELMREYVTLAGSDDGLVRLIVMQLGPAVRQERERKRRIDAERKAAEEAEAAKASGRRDSAEAVKQRDPTEAVKRWQEYREALRSVIAQAKSENDLRRNDFKLTTEHAGRAKPAIELFRSQFVEGWRAIGVPRVDEVRLDPWLVADYVSSADESVTADFASSVSDLWMADYARLLDKTVEEAKEFIRRFVRDAYRIGEDLVAPHGRSESPTSGSSDAAGELSNSAE